MNMNDVLYEYPPDDDGLPREYLCPCGCENNVEYCVYAAICPNCHKKFYGNGYARRDQLCSECQSAAASPPNGARDHSEARLDEGKDETLCIKCGKRERYVHKGRVFALCAVCGWNNLKELLDLPDTAAELRNEADRSGDENSNMELCGNCGVPRFIHGGVLEKCPNCGDDEWDLALRSEYP